MLKKHFQSGFTLTETIITVVIFALILVAVFSVYTLSHKAYRKGERSAEITQNSRVVLERMVREIRQTREMVTELPVAIDSEIPDDAVSAIEFEDGHIEELYNYIRYFKENNFIKREVVGYYFSGDAGETLVPWNSSPPGGQTLETKIISEVQSIGEYISDLNIWGSKLIHIALTAKKGTEEIELRTKIFGRNF